MTSDYVIRRAEEDDAEALVELFDALDREATYMLFEPGERSLDSVRQRNVIRDMNEGGSRVVFIAVSDGVALGFVGVTRMLFRRRRHLGQIVVGVRRKHHRMGIGDALLGAAESWASDNGVRRLELAVAVPNTPAVALYEKRGYVSEGTRAGSLRIGDHDVDEYHMALELADR